MGGELCAGVQDRYKGNRQTKRSPRTAHHKVGTKNRLRGAVRLCDPGLYTRLLNLQQRQHYNPKALTVARGCVLLIIGFVFPFEHWCPSSAHPIPWALMGKLGTNDRKGTNGRRVVFI